VDHLGPCHLDEITALKLEGFAVKFSANLQPATIARKLAVLSGALTFAVRRGWLPARPVFPRVKVANTQERFLTKAEIQLLLEHLEGSAFHDFIEALFVTGMRRGELAGLLWEHVDLEAGFLRLPATLCKSGKGRAVPMNDSARAVIRRQLGRARPDAPVLHKDGHPLAGDGASRAFQIAARRAGLGHVRLHDARHTYASALVQAGVPLLDVAAILGHQGVGVTLRYAHLAPDGLARAARHACLLDPVDPTIEGVRQTETEVIPFPRKPAATAG
jgi:integrase